jgi:predicted phosphodiesterase
MKLIVISDIHGRPTWKDIVDQNKQADKFIILGDYFDSFDIASNEQIINFQDIIKFKEENKDNVVLLTGNHDVHYLAYYLNSGEHYSGFQRSKAYEISHLIQANLAHLQMAYRHNDILFTHAGVTNTWLKNNGFNKEDDVVEFVNQLFIHRPAAFRFVGLDPYGDSPGSSPIWIRPGSLMNDAYQLSELKQVVGHTQYKNIVIIKERYYFTDAPESGEYLCIEDDKISIRNLFR